MIDNARWIWCNASPEQTNRHAYFRRTLNLEAPPVKALVQCGADTWYRLIVNGTFVATGPSRGAVAEPAYDTHDIAGLLRPGVNVIAFHVHAYGKVERCSSFIPIRGGLIAAVLIDDRAPILTDERWKCHAEMAYRADTPRHSSHQGFVECFDARAALRGWAAPAFDDRDWAAAVPLGLTAELPPWRKLTPRTVPMLTRTLRPPARLLESGRLAFPPEHDPADLRQLAPAIAGARRLADPAAVRFEDPRDEWPVTVNRGYVIFDFAENAAGFVRLTLRGEAGSVINLAYSESLTGGLVEAHKQTVRYVDRLILGGDELDHTIMLPKTFRYLFIHVDGRATIRHLSHEVRHYPFRWRGWFYSSDAVLDATWRVGAHTVAISTEDLYIDTPRRERAGWLADMVPEADAAYHAFGDYGLARHSLELFLGSQDQPGLYVPTSTGPRGWLLSRYPSIDPSSMPDYNASVGFAVRDYVLYSGDTAFAAAQWGRLTALTDYLLHYRNADGLIEFGRGDYVNASYVLVDWAPFDRNGACSALNMLCHAHLLAMAELAQAIGNEGAARRHREEADRLARAIRAKLFDPARGLFVNGRVGGALNARAGYQENLLALIWELADEEQAASIRRQLLADDRPLPVWEPEEDIELYPILRQGLRPEWNDAELVPIGSPYFTYFALWALFETGRATAALNTIRRQYGQCLATGATSFWEEWNGSKSHSHGWGAGPTALLVRYIAGIQPTSPGCATCDVLPDPADLAHARASLPTPRGAVEVEWRRRDTGLCLEVSVPPGMTVRAGLPSTGDRLSVNGWPQPARRVVTRRGTFATVSLTEGRYGLSPSPP